MICQHCNGTGIKPDHRAEGEKWRKARLRKGISCREMARLLNLSASYISDLELGRRSWNTKIAQLYKQKLATTRQAMT